MQGKSSTKSILILVAVVLLAGAAYFYFTGTPEDAASLLVIDGAVTSEASIQATRIITLLNQTKSLRIDTKLFSTQAYRSLVDYTVPVVPQPVGKQNPFFYTVSAPATQ